MLSNKSKLQKLRKLMQTRNIDVCLINQTDEFQNEFLPTYSQRLQWLTNFSGSAGEAIITMSKAYLFVDGRYTLQAKNEVNKNIYKVYNYTEKTPTEILKSFKFKKINFGMDGNIISVKKFNNLTSEIGKNVSIKLLKENLVDLIWHDRPKIKKSIIWHHHYKFHGTKVSDKIKSVTKIIKKQQAQYLFVSSNESICWLLNLRSNDLPYTPIFMSRLIISASGECFLFANIKSSIKFSKQIKIHQIEPKFLTSFLSNTVSSQKIIADPRTLPSNIYQSLKKLKSKIKLIDDSIEILKSQKNNTEIKGVRSAHLRDGVALTKAIFWIKESVMKKGLTELQAVKRIDTNRSKNKHFHSLSFPTIAGSGPNGAIVHYHANKKTNRIIKDTDLFLIDSGGQYLDGTTDVTRTISFNKVSKEQKKMNTLVLKGHIAVATSKFSKSETGKNLNVNARKYLKEHNCNFDHGTGHGVGYFLNVHEGPQSISSVSKVKFLPGMIISNEPGYYKANAYGIRIENLITVRKLGNKYEFENLTLAPIDKKLIEVSLLTTNEISWLNTYHKLVYSKLNKYLKPKEKIWLKAECSNL
ncbi:MAG: aminopeptidase P family protein [Candidatus Pelagibacterales bacterium]|jgi:Xaa-Pro aminopeptidase|tara:strand:+ start:1686 stop:3434 length:1749 start_codon:yes stop_codon:yes gene_type:complete